ncbi:MAG TPA: nucleotidyltransferase family protein [Caulobacteraceae bacterium]
MATEGGLGLALEAVVLAAGAGTRFGGAKLTAPWRGGRLIDAAVAAALAAPVRSVIVVTGADAAVAQAVGPHRRLRLVHAADHAEGMAASLRAGVAALPPDADGVFVFLGDMPRIPHAILPALATALAGGALAAAPVFAGRRGHPVLFARSMLLCLLRLTGDEGAKSVLDRLGLDLVLVESIDDGVLFDVDARGDS